MGCMGGLRRQPAGAGGRSTGRVRVAWGLRGMGWGDRGGAGGGRHGCGPFARCACVSRTCANATLLAGIISVNFLQYGVSHEACIPPQTKPNQLKRAEHTQRH